MNRARMVLLGFCAIWLQAAHGAAQAQDYPVRPVKIIVPTPPGGPVDVMGRIAANYLQGALGQPFFVENRAGAGNTIGSKDAAEATPDGYTLLYSAASGLIIAPLLHPDAGFAITAWTGLLAPAHTPPPIVAKLNAAINDGLRKPELLDALTRVNFQPIGGTPADFTAMMTAELARWSPIITSLGLDHPAQ
jgi:tripartite-type tricarboxylate transporter receptor subunit TctC